jgi:hypothetical protein
MRSLFALCLALAACGDSGPSTTTADGGAGCGTPPAGLVFAPGGCSLICPLVDGSLVNSTCPRDGSAPYCANTQTDPRNCGDCGHVCPDCSTFGGSPRCELGQCFCR